MPYCFFSEKSLFLKRILGFVEHAFRLIETNILNAEIFEHVEERLAKVTKRNCTVMRISLRNENVTVETSHLRNTENTNTTEGTGRNRQNLTLCNICFQLGVSCALETEESDRTRLDVTFKGTTADIRLAVRLKATMLNELVLQSILGQFAGVGVTAMEAHKGIFVGVIELTFDIAVVHICRNSVVDVKQSNDIFRNELADVLGQSAININFAGNRNATAGQAAVDIARAETKLGLERRPAFVSKRNKLSGTFVRFRPVQKGKLKLSKLRNKVFPRVVASKLFLHVSNNFRNARIVFVLLNRSEKIELRVLFYFNAEVEELLNRRIASEEVVRTRTEGNDLQVL